MVPVSARTGLTAAQVDDIRAALAGGRRPKVVFTAAAGQIAGQFGQVVKLTDPDQTDEWVVVQFGRDELPFAPTDIAIPVRGAQSAKPTKKVTTAIVDSPPGPELMIVRDVPNRRPASDVPRPREESMMAASNNHVASTLDAPAAAKKPAKQAKPKMLPSVTITIAYTEGEWTVGAVQGTKALAKPYLIKPTEVLKIVSLLDVPGVNEVVGQVVAADRADAESQAERLRAELAEIEARIAELRQAR